MRAIIFDHPGDESVLHLGEAPSPEPGPGELKLRVRATAVNRADLLQRRGLYPPPPGVSPILGMEAAGEVVALGDSVAGWKLGARAMALLAGGGYAEEVVVDAASAMPVPERLSWEEAGAVPEVFITAYLNLFLLGRLGRGETALIHGGSSGVGTAAIQLVREAGARPVVTVRDETKAARCRELGAETILYPTEDFVARVQALTGGRGAEVILDSLGALYLERNLRALATGGRLVIIGLMGGASAELDLGRLLARRITVMGSTLRARPLAEKAEIVRSFREAVWPLLDRGVARPIIDRVLPLAAAAEAHRLVASSAHVGKVVLRVS